MISNKGKLLIYPGVNIKSHFEKSVEIENLNSMEQNYLSKIDEHVTLFSTRLKCTIIIS